jgi:hypothetical protein
MGSSKGSGVRADLKKNRLYITIAGRLNKKDLESLYTDIRFCVADLQPGFAVVNDLSECTLAALSGLPVFKKITDHLITNEVSEVIRIVDKRRIVFKQILNASAMMSGYTPVYATSLEEAEELLDAPR